MVDWKFWLKKCLLSGLEVATHGAWLATGSGGRVTITNPQYFHKDHETKKNWIWLTKEIERMSMATAMHLLAWNACHQFIRFFMYVDERHHVWCLDSSASILCLGLTQVPICPSRTGPAPQPTEILEEISRGLPVCAIVRRCTGMCLDDYLYDVRA